MQRTLARWVLLVAWVWLASPAQSEDSPEATLIRIDFDTLIVRGGRLEFYVREDFFGDCEPCLTPQHVNCEQSCYLKARNLSLICTHAVKGLSLGPFDRAERQNVLSDLLKTDSVIFATDQGESFLQGTRISSQSAGIEGVENFSIEIEGFRGLRPLVESSVTPGLESFQMRVGTRVLTAQLQLGIRSKFNDFIRQCPDG